MEIILYSNLKFLREKFNLSQEEIAKLIKKKKSVIGNYEKGTSSPTINSLVKISIFFGITLDDLIKQDLRLREEKLLNFLIEDKSTFGKNISEPRGKYSKLGDSSSSSPDELESLKGIITNQKEVIEKNQQFLNQFLLLHNILLKKYDDMHLKNKLRNIQSSR